MKPGDDSSTGAVKHGVQAASAHANDSDNCYQLALRYIEHRQRSEAEVYRYLYSKNAFSDEAIETAKSVVGTEEIVDVEIIEYKKNVVYDVETKKESKLFALFKTKVKIRAMVGIDEGKVVKIKKSWWAFLAKGDKVNI